MTTMTTAIMTPLEVNHVRDVAGSEGALSGAEIPLPPAMEKQRSTSSANGATSTTVSVLEGRNMPTLPKHATELVNDVVSFYSLKCLRNTCAATEHATVA